MSELKGGGLSDGTQYVLVCPQCFCLLAESAEFPDDTLNRAVMFLQAQSHQAAFSGPSHIPEVVGVNDKSITPYTELYLPYAHRSSSWRVLSAQDNCGETDADG